MCVCGGSTTELKSGQYSKTVGSRSVRRGTGRREVEGMGGGGGAPKGT